MEEIHSDDERTLEVSAEEALKYEHGEIWVEVPEDRLVDLAHLGRRIWGQVAVLDGLEQRDPTAPVVFVDVRGRGWGWGWGWPYSRSGHNWKPRCSAPSSTMRPWICRHCKVGRS